MDEETRDAPEPLVPPTPIPPANEEVDKAHERLRFWKGFLTTLGINLLLILSLLPSSLLPDMVWGTILIILIFGNAIAMITALFMQNGRNRPVARGILTCYATSFGLALFFFFGTCLWTMR